MEKKIYCKHDGKDEFMYTVDDGFLSVDIVERGARINAIRVGGVDVALGFRSADDYLKSATYAGATVGRVANRIADGKFALGGKEYALFANNGKNSLHGGACGFDRKTFSRVEFDGDSVTLEYASADGEEGYPGLLTMRVKFTLKGGALNMEYSATSDADTLWSPTNHTYFNLDGEDCENCLQNVVGINSDFYTPTTDDLIPLGTTKNVSGTVFDFRSPRAIGEDFKSPELKNTNGYDHNYILKDRFAAEALGVNSGIRLKLFTDLPCMQFYTGGSICEKNCRGKTRNYGVWSGFCLEPQYAPDAINSSAFAKPIVKRGETVKHYIRYEFTKK